MTRQAIYTLYKYSLDVWFDLFYLFCGYQHNYGDISLFVKCPLFSNMAQLSGSRSEVNLREVLSIDGIGSRLCRSPWRPKLVCYSEQKGRSLFQQSLIYVSFCLFFHRVNLHSFNALVRGVICRYTIYFCPNPCFIFGRVWNSLSKYSTQKLLQNSTDKCNILFDLHADNVIYHISYFVEQELTFCCYGNIQQISLFITNWVRNKYNHVTN